MSAEKSEKEIKHVKLSERYSPSDMARFRQGGNILTRSEPNRSTSSDQPTNVEPRKNDRKGNDDGNFSI